MPYVAATHFRSGGNSEALRTQFNAVVADVLDVRTELAALRLDLIAVRDELLLELDDIEALRTGSVILTTPVLAIGTVDAAELKHDAFQVRILGVTVDVPAAEVALTATTHDVAAHATNIERRYDVSVQADGAVIITAGAVAASGASTAGATPAGNISVGDFFLRTDTTLFDAVTMDLDEAGVVASAFNSDAIEVLTASDPAALTASAPAAVTGLALTV